MDRDGKFLRYIVLLILVSLACGVNTGILINTPTVEVGQVTPIPQVAESVTVIVENVYLRSWEGEIMSSAKLGDTFMVVDLGDGRGWIVGTSWYIWMGCTSAADERRCLPK